MYNRPDIPWRGYDREQSILWAAGVLGAEEKVVVERLWRHEFDRANTAGFFHCAGVGQFLEGEAARAAHFRSVDIPRELLRRWERQRTKKEPRASPLQGPVSQPEGK